MNISESGDVIRSLVARARRRVLVFSAIILLAGFSSACGDDGGSGDLSSLPEDSTTTISTESPDGVPATSTGVPLTPTLDGRGFADAAAALPDGAALAALLNAQLAPVAVGGLQDGAASNVGENFSICEAPSPGPLFGYFIITQAGSLGLVGLSLSASNDEAKATVAAIASQKAGCDLPSSGDAAGTLAGAGIKANFNDITVASVETFQHNSNPGASVVFSDEKLGAVAFIAVDNAVVTAWIDPGTAQIAEDAAAIVADELQEN